MGVEHIAEYDRAHKPPQDILIFGYDRTNKRYVALQVDADGKVETTS